MTDDERIQTAINKAMVLLREAEPSASFILIQVAGEKKNYGARLFGGTPNQINAAIKNTMVYASLHCADGLNSLVKKMADILPGVRKMMAPTPKVAVALLKEAIETIEKGDLK